MANVAADVHHRRSVGTVAQGFEPVQNELDAMLLTDPAFSAQLTVYWRGEVVVDLTGGADLSSASITGVYSASKGVSAIALSTLIRSGGLDLDQTVVHYWPEFAAHGKDRILVRELLTHQAGLVNVDAGLTDDDLIHSEQGAAKLAAQRPLWRPGSSFGYHGLTIGIFMEELTRRIADESLQNIYESQVRAPRAIDFYLGLPESEEHRFQRVLPMRPTPQQSAEIASNSSASDSLTAFMYNSLHTDVTLAGDDIGPNSRAVRAAGPAALGGIGSAHGLARLYASALGFVGEPILDEETIAAVSQQQVWGHDRTLDVDMCFGIVFMKPQPRMEFGSYRAFGHDGAGGAIGFADPMYDMGFGYIPMPMSYPGGADPRGIRLSQIARRSILGATRS